jgi:hypothetical protein
LSNTGVGAWLSPAKNGAAAGFGLCVMKLHCAAFASE